MREASCMADVLMVLYAETLTALHGTSEGKDYLNS
jgi:hypothetical protein